MLADLRFSERAYLEVDDGSRTKDTAVDQEPGDEGGAGVEPNGLTNDAILQRLREPQSPRGRPLRSAPPLRELCRAHGRRLAGRVVLRCRRGGSSDRERAGSEPRPGS